jgi:hypothetical protein
LVGGAGAMRLLSIAGVNRLFWPVIWITTLFLRMNLLITCFCKRNLDKKYQNSQSDLIMLLAN